MFLLRLADWDGVVSNWTMGSFWPSVPRNFVEANERSDSIPKPFQGAIRHNTDQSSWHAEPQKANRQGPTVGCPCFGHVSLINVTWLLGDLTVQCISLQSNKSEQNQVIFKSPLAINLPFLLQQLYPGWSNYIPQTLFVIDCSQSPFFLRKIVTPTPAPSVHMAARTDKPSLRWSWWQFSPKMSHKNSQLHYMDNIM